MKISFTWINLFMLAFEAKAMHSLPVKFLDSALKQPAAQESPFSWQNIFQDDFVQIKQAEWKACHQHSLNLTPQIESAYNESLSGFLETNKFLSKLTDMETQNLKESSASIDPWSGDYWAYSRGLLGFRFLDSEFLNNYDWNSRYQYIQKNPASALIEKNGQATVKNLSPSEKYDLIVGDTAFALTSSMWSQGKKYYDESGTVEDWMGICHGWASASIIVPRPAKSVQITSDDQKYSVDFNPSEIKGLVSYSWATNSYPARSLGVRCNTKNPERDENGRIIDPDCFDLNPAAWHISVVHMLGKLKRAFVMDATYDYEVWNQPVKSYKYSYFNVNTGENISDLTLAAVKKSDLINDQFAKYRSEMVDAVVGVRMQVAYIVESPSTAVATDSVNRDIIRWVQYVYDLELDSSGSIIGGEWKTWAHPDFIWAPYPQARPLSNYDVKLIGTQWDTTKSLPQEWVSAAQKASSHGMILNRIAEGILNKAAQP